MNKKLFLTLLIVLYSSCCYAAETTVTKYFDNRKAAMALNYDTELYIIMLHSGGGYNPETSATRAQHTLDGWPNVIADCEIYNIPVSFNLCGYEAVFGDEGRSEVNDIDIYQYWHVDYWKTHTWYSDMPWTPANYKTVGDLSGYTRSYSLVYGGPLTEQTMNSPVPFEISYHNFGHEKLNAITAENMDDTFRLGVAYHKRIGSKIMSEAPPWNVNPQPEKYPIYIDNGIFVYNRWESSMGEPYEVIDNLWIIPRNGSFNATTDLTGAIDSAINNGKVLAYGSHPEEFYMSDRSGFQTTLAYARSKVASGELWATTLNQIGRYWEAKSDAATITEIVDSNTTMVSITLNDYDAPRFGIPYLTFATTMPNAADYAKITVDYPTTQILDSNAVRIVDANVIYTIYLNPAGTTNVEIEGVDAPYINGVNINLPVLTIDSAAPENPVADRPVTIEAETNSPDSIYSVNIIYQCNDYAKDSKIMDYNNGIWKTNIGPFQPGENITYYVSVTDNSGRRERSNEKSFTIGNSFYDLNENGFIDYEDLGILTDNWLNTEPIIQGDFNLDGTANFLDFAEFAESWTSESGQTIYDLNNNGSIDYDDLRILTSNWLNTEPSIQGDFNLNGIVNFPDFAEFAEVW